MKTSMRVYATIITAALGYFVDIYDLILFSVVREQSLKDIGMASNELLPKGVFLLNMQMAGMLLGGILWGLLGDKRGRVSVLFGSIFLYSIANLLNAFVGSIFSYAILRFLAGIGLAGELGAAITLVCEIMSKEKRGYGTTIVASLGICGAVLASVVARSFNWKVAYIVGGVMGLLLLILRWGIYESGMYHNMKAQNVERGNPLYLINSWEKFIRYLNCILIGVPIWYVIGILVTFSPELAVAMGAPEKVIAGKSIMYCYIGLALGDLSSGFLSQLVQSRKKIVFVFLMLTFLTSAAFLLWKFLVLTISAQQIYWLCGVLGFATGYWAVFVTVASEQFGTNIRATVTTTVPNFVRGAVVPVSSVFTALRPQLGMIGSAMAVGFIVLTIAFISLYGLRETYGKNLDYLE